MSKIIRTFVAILGRRQKKTPHTGSQAVQRTKESPLNPPKGEEKKEYCKYKTDTK